MTPERAIAECARITRRHSSTFHLGSRLFPPAQRRAVTVVYAVCRVGDDAVDEAPDPATARARLDAWWRGLENAYAGVPGPEASLQTALAWVLERHPVPRAAFEELRLGLEGDLAGEPPADLDALMLYCRRVGGVIGLMIAPIAGYRGGDATLRDAVALGQAMQLTNVLRDVGEDLRRGRIYLPDAEMARYGVHPDALRAGQPGDGYVELLRDLAARADRLYHRGWRSIDRLHGTAPLAVGLAALAYQGILRKLERNGYDNLTRRAHLRGRERVALLPSAVLRVAGGRLAGGSADGGEP